MLQLSLPPLKTVLCLGAHSDDIEIGCGGTVLKLIGQYPALRFFWVVFSAEGSRAQEARASARTFLKGARQQTILIKKFRNSFFPFQGTAIKECFEELKRKIQPDLIFTHYRDDRHQDHRTISDLTWNTWRDHLILEYEIPKYDGDLGIPNFFVHLSQTLCSRKIRHLLSFFQTQANKHWFDDGTFRALMRIRGVESAAPNGYAEAFYCRKLLGF